MIFNLFKKLFDRFFKKKIDPDALIDKIIKGLPLLKQFNTYTEYRPEFGWDMYYESNAYHVEVDRYFNFFDKMMAEYWTRETLMDHWNIELKSNCWIEIFKEGDLVLIKKDSRDWSGGSCLKIYGSEEALLMALLKYF